jgi:hypothetical protein
VSFDCPEKALGTAMLTLLTMTSDLYIPMPLRGDQHSGR